MLCLALSLAALTACGQGGEGTQPTGQGSPGLETPAASAGAVTEDPAEAAEAGGYFGGGDSGSGG